MKKASKQRVTTKPAQKKPPQKKPAARQARPKTAEDGVGLAKVVAQLAMSAEKLAQAADRLAEATARLSVTEPAQPDKLDSPAASAMPQPESEMAAAAETEQPSAEQAYTAGQGGGPATDS